MSITQNNLCIIPARGGSKRIPRKNIKDFLGKPIIAYSIEAALSSGLFSEVMVSTDDEEIAEVAKKYGANVPFLRDATQSDDFTPLREVFCNVIDQYGQNEREFDFFCSILATAPMVTAEHLRASYSKLSDENRSVISITEYDFPIQRFLHIENGTLKVGSKDNYSKRSQDLELTYHDAGQFYWANCDEYIDKKSFFELNPFGYELANKLFYDIDTVSDWERVEAIYRFTYGA